MKPIPPRNMATTPAVSEKKAATPATKTALSMLGSSTNGKILTLSEVGYISPDNKCGVCGNYNAASGICELANDYVAHDGGCYKHFKLSDLFTEDAMRQANGGKMSWENPSEEDYEAEDGEGEEGEAEGETEGEEKAEGAEHEESEGEYV